MKKFFAFVLCGAALLTLAACAAKSGSGSQSGYAYVPNPFVDYETLKDAVKAAGFDFTVPDKVAGYSEKLVQLMSGKMLQVSFRNGDSRLTVRKQAGDEDISGDYNEYSETEVVTVGDFEVTLRGNDGKVSNATWTAGGYSFAIVSDTPLERSDMLDLIGQIK